MEETSKRQVKLRAPEVLESFGQLKCTLFRPEVSKEVRVATLIMCVETLTKLLEYRGKALPVEPLSCNNRAWEECFGVEFAVERNTPSALSKQSC